MICLKNIIFLTKILRIYNKMHRSSGLTLGSTSRSKAYKVSFSSSESPGSLSVKIILVRGVLAVLQADMYETYQF